MKDPNIKYGNFALHLMSSTNCSYSNCTEVETCYNHRLVVDALNEQYRLGKEDGLKQAIVEVRAAEVDTQGEFDSYVHFNRAEERLDSQIKLLKDEK